MRTVTLGNHTFYLPFIDLIPYDDDQFADLVESIKTAGCVMVPVVCWAEKKGSSHDTVVDGAHRVVAAEALGLDRVPRIHRYYESDTQAAAACETLNYDRRQVPEAIVVERRMKRRGQVLEKRQAGESLRKIAEDLNVSKDTVAKDLSFSGVYPQTPDEILPILPETVSGKDGKEYAAKKPPKLCQRCQRVGAVPGCPGCVDANRPVQTRPVPSGKPREPSKSATNGVEHFSIRAFEECLGKGLAMLDRLAKQLGHFEDRSARGQVVTPVVMTPDHQAIADHINDAMTKAKAWALTLKS